MRSSPVASLLAAVGLVVPAAAQSFIAPGDLDRVLGASIARAIEAADRVDADTRIEGASSGPTEA